MDALALLGAMASPDTLLMTQLDIDPHTFKFTHVFVHQQDSVYIKESECGLH